MKKIAISVLFAILANGVMAAEVKTGGAGVRANNPVKAPVMIKVAPAAKSMTISCAGNGAVVVVGQQIVCQG